MFEFQESISTATSYIDSATKVAQGTVALITSITSARTSLDKFIEIFSKSRSINSHPTTICHLLKNYDNESIADVKNLSGILSPIMPFKGEEKDNYRDVSALISNNVKKLKTDSTERQFLTINSSEWLSYGCSLQSTTQDRIQLLSLIEEEEANRVSVLVTKDFYNKKLNYPNIKYGVEASVSGLMIPINNKIISTLVGQCQVDKLKLSGQQYVLLPDESIIKDLGLDFSFTPNIVFNTEKCFFLGYLWAIYIDVYSEEIVPIYEYGNIGEKNSFIMLSEKLIHQIEFFKKRIWNELDTSVGNRRYRLLIAYNDELFERIQSVFQEDNFFESRETIISNLFS